jgi:hypothetical protein
MDAHPGGKEIASVMRSTHGVLGAGLQTQSDEKSLHRDVVTTSPFAAKFAAVWPYAGNGLLRNFEPFNP